MATLLEKVAKTRDELARAQAAFRAALVAAKEVHSWPEIAAVAGLKRSGVRWHVKQARKEKKDG